MQEKKTKHSKSLSLIAGAGGKSEESIAQPACPPWRRRVPGLFAGISPINGRLPGGTNPPARPERRPHANHVRPGGFRREPAHFHAALSQENARTADLPTGRWTYYLYLFIFYFFSLDVTKCSLGIQKRLFISLSRSIR